jgi:hypothetical protein
MVNFQNNCKICSSKSELLMSDHILNNKYKINYFVCLSCKCIYTETPYWLKESYSNVISSSDTGIMLRNSRNLEFVLNLIKKNFSSNIKVVDYGGGYGILTRMLRDHGIDAYWFDKFAENLLARGFEYNSEDRVDLMLAFEVVEHSQDPLADIKKIMQKTDCFIFSTELITKLNYTSNYEWWYFGRDSGQHIFFPSYVTMLKISEIIGCKYQNIEGIHILHRNPQDLKFKNRFEVLKSKLLKTLLNSNNKDFNNSKTISDHNYILSLNNKT